MPTKEFYAWHNEPTLRELLDAHLANISSILINSKSKTKVNAKDLMILFTKEDKKDSLAKEIQAGLKSRFKVVVKK